MIDKEVVVASRMYPFSYNFSLLVFPGGSSVASNERCNEYSFGVRGKLFAEAKNFLIVPGDNEWNECCTYDEDSNTDVGRRNWRNTFALDPAFQLNEDFPPTQGFPGGSKPDLRRNGSDEDENPEMYAFVHNKVLVVGLNRVARESWLSDNSGESPDRNARWMDENLDLDENCELESTVIIAQTDLKSSFYDELEDYFVRCGRKIPALVITGNDHPSTYCFEGPESDYLFEMVVEAFRSGPLHVSVVRDPSGEVGDFFHVEDTQLDDSNSNCPFD